MGLLHVQEGEAARKRAKADMERAKMEARIKALAQELSATEEAVQRKKQAVLAGLQAKKLEKAVAAQVWAMLAGPLGMHP